MRRALCICAAVLFLLSIAAGASARAENAAKPRREKRLFDLPVGYYVAAGAICVAIGAAGGIAYAGIMGPKRTTRRERESS
ncbi:MAG: hypothetical protein M3290_05465 [Actinomycetota bacterium]|nr:hypothetical protein [Actinomycetota bacterium]